MSGTAVETVPAAEVGGGSFAEYEVGDADLGDVRRTRRLVRMLDRFFDKPLASIPQAAGDWAFAKAVYRFMDNDQIDPDEILLPHRNRTAERAREHSVVLAIGDTTMLDYTRHPKTTGLGPLSDLEHQGLMLQPTLVVTEDRVPLGLIDQMVWTRDEETFGPEHGKERAKLPIEEKESFKWIRSLAAASDLGRDLAAAGAKTRVVSVFDREGDIYDVFAKAIAPGTCCDLLVRAKNDRRVDHMLSHLWLTMETRPRAGTVALSLPSTAKRKARETELTLRHATLTLLPPDHRKKEGFEPITIQVVFANEENPPKGADPVSWMLLTTAAVESFEDACRVLSWYCGRWSIELLIRITKSGCKAEERQLETAERLKRCLVLDLIVAWRVLYLTTVGRDTPDLPCTVIFEDHEWRSLYIFVYKTETKVPKEPPTLRQVTRLIGKLGGHLGRKSDKEPGQTVMWRGLSRLSDISAFYLIRLAQMRGEPDSDP